MKNTYLAILLLSGVLSNAQVGIKTSNPRATLDVTATNATGSASNVDGLLVPRIDRLRAQSMANIPTSTMIYVNSVATGTQTGITQYVDAVGYYYFNGTVWVKLENPKNVNVTSVNIYNSDGTLTGNRAVSQLGYTLGFNGTAANAFSVNGNTFSVDGANNRVGIGTTAPENKLHIVSSAAANNRFLLFDAPEGNSQQVIMALRNTSPAATGNYALLGFTNSGTTSGGANWGIGSVRTASTEDFFLGNSTGGNYLERMRITSAGKVGIGTSTPQESLHVNGSMQLTNELSVGGNASAAGNPGTAGQFLTSNGAGAAPAWTDSPIDTDGTVNIARVAHNVVNVNSRDNGTYTLDQTNGPNYTIWVSHPGTSGCDVQLPAPTTQQRRVVNIVAASDTNSVRVCGAPLYVTGTTTINEIPAGKRIIIGASNIFGGIWYVTMKDF